MEPHLYEKGEKKLVVFITVSELLTNEFSFCIGQKNSVFSPLVLVTISFLICDRLIKIRLELLIIIFHRALSILKCRLVPEENKENTVIRLVSWNRNDRLHVLHSSHALFTFGQEVCDYIEIGVTIIWIKLQESNVLKSQVLTDLLIKKEHEGNTEMEGE